MNLYDIDLLVEKQKARVINNRYIKAYEWLTQRKYNHTLNTIWLEYIMNKKWSVTQIQLFTMYLLKTEPSHRVLECAL